MNQAKVSELKEHFLGAVSGDSPCTKLWKYRYFIKTNLNAAKLIQNQMLDLALKNKFIGQYELIHQSYGIVPQRVGKYAEIREQMILTINRFKNEAIQYESINNIEEMVRCYFKIAEFAADYALHEEAASHYSKIFRNQTEKTVFKREQYFSKWAQQVFYQGDYTNLGMFLTCILEDPKKIDINLALLKDLKLIQMKKGKIFENLLNSSFNFKDILQNSVISLADLGILYSLLALSFKDRSFLKKDVKWSSKLQIPYLRNDYRKLFSDIEKCYQNIGKFHPIIDDIYGNCYLLIKKRVIQEILESYDIISFKKINELSSIKEAEIIRFVKQNKQLPYLIDPITQSVVHYQKNVPLYEQADTYYQIIRQKFEDKKKSFMIEIKSEDEEGMGMLSRMKGRF